MTKACTAKSHQDRQTDRQTADGEEYVILVLGLKALELEDVLDVLQLVLPPLLSHPHL
jgi:hypothetical protein